MASKRSAAPLRQTPPAPKAPTRDPEPAPAEARIVLPGSERLPLPPGDLQGTAAPRKRSSRAPLTISVLVRRKQPLPAADLEQARVSRSQFRANYGADPTAVKAVKIFAKQFGLTAEATPAQLEARTLKLSGTRDQLQQAFGVTLSEQAHGKETYRVREGAIYIPQALEGLVEAVLGLDDRPQAAAQFRIAHSRTPGRTDPAAAGGSFTPPQIAQLYQFPANASAAGQTIGLIELGGGYRTADLSAYFKSLGLKAPAVVSVSVDGGKNSPSTASGADSEVMLDIEIAAAVAPGSNIVVYFAPNTDQGFVDAITTAVHDSTNKPSVLSISWGGPESSWTRQALTALDSACQAAALLGVTITVAAGDNGSTDGVTDGASHVDFPASSPHVLACGGTTITASGNSLTKEVVWNELSASEGATGGGVSTIFPLPAWQANANIPAPAAKKKKRKPTGGSGTGDAAGSGRGVPDVAGSADPVAGYTIRVDGQTIAVGGTSAVAPLWAGLIAVSNAHNGSSAGFLNPTLYSNPGAFRDITSGNNGAYKAGPGWDPCTGLGSPVGTAIIAALAAARTTGSGRKGGKKAAAIRRVRQA